MLRNTTSRPLRILHISDLHERAAFDKMPDDRQPKLDLDARERGRVLGDSFLQELHSLVGSGIDLVCFTGDLADWGHPAEYAKAVVRLRQILDSVEVPPSRFFAVPGNHDVQRREQEAAWRGVRRWLARGGDSSALGRWVHHAQEVPPGLKPAWRDQILQRSGAFWDCLDSLQRGELRPLRHAPLGYRRTLPAGTFGHIHLPIHVVGLNSAWLCGGDETKAKVTLKDDKSILLTTEQVDAHIRDGERALDGFRLALVHHPLEFLADYHDVRRLLGDNGVDLLLHGHQHKEVSMTQRESGACLSVLAAGCLMEGDQGKNWPNGFHLIEVDVTTGSGSVHFRQWSKDSRGWAPATGIYREARDGVLPLELRARVNPELVMGSRVQMTSRRASAVPSSPRVVDGVSVSVVLERQTGADESLSERWIKAIEASLREAGVRVESDSADHTFAVWADYDELGGQSLHYRLNMQGPCNLPMSRLEEGAASVTEVAVQHVIATQISRGEPVVVRLVNWPREHPSPCRTTFRLEAPQPVNGQFAAAGERWLTAPLERIATALSRVSPSVPIVIVPQCTPSAAIRAGAVLNRVAGQPVHVIWQGAEWSLDTAGNVAGELTHALDGHGFDPRDHLCLLVSISQNVRPAWLPWAQSPNRVSLRELYVSPATGPSQDVLKTPEQAVGWARQIGQWLREYRPPPHSATSIFAAAPGPVSLAIGRELNAIGRVCLLDFDKERQEYVNAFEFTA